MMHHAPFPLELLLREALLHESCWVFGLGYLDRLLNIGLILSQ
jgi:hypothetical protein